MHRHLLERIKRTKATLFQFLRMTEKITGIDNVYFFKGGFWMMIAQVAFVLAGLALTIAFTRLGDKVLYGKYQFVLGLVATFMITMLPGANTALMQAVSRGYEKTLYPIFKQKFLWSLLGVAGLLVTAGYFLRVREDTTLAWIFTIAALNFPFLFWNTLVNSFFAGKGDFAHANFYLIVERLLTTAAVCAVLFITTNVVIVILTYFFVSTIANIIFFAQFQMSFPLKPKTDPQATRYSWDVTLMNILPKALLNADRLLIPAFLGVEALAVYLIAIIIPDTIENFMSLMHMVAFKKLVALKQQRIIPKLFQWWILAFFGAVIFITIIALPLAIQLLYGPDYASSIHLGQWYVWILPATFLWKIFYNWLLAQKKVKECFAFTNGFYVVNAAALTGVLWFIPSLDGVILARVAVMAFFALCSLLYLHFYRTNPEPSFIKNA